MRIALLHVGFAEVTLDSGETVPADLVYSHVRAETVRETIPMLEAAAPDIVIIKFQTSGGDWMESYALAEVFQRQFEPRWRTIAWLDGLHGSPVLSAWSINELVMAPGSTVGPCLPWQPLMVCPPFGDDGLAHWRELGELVSAWGDHDPSILASMQRTVPLSYELDANGHVRWRPDVEGSHVLNGQQTVLQLDAATAEAVALTMGTARTKSEVLELLDVANGVWVGQEADAHLRSEAIATASAEQEARLAFREIDDALRALMNARSSKEAHKAAHHAENRMRVLWSILDDDPRLVPLVFGTTQEGAAEVYSEWRRIIKEVLADR